MIPGLLLRNRDIAARVYVATEVNFKAGISRVGLADCGVNAKWEEGLDV